jgi:predicted O-linked N-acetylglucosamine transferase (SPINDLY family)
MAKAKSNGDGRDAGSAQTGEVLAAALAAQRAGDPERAAALSRRILAQSPDQPDALQILGVALAQLGESDDAAASFERALALQPDNAGVLFNHATLMRRAGQDGKAAGLFRAAIAAAPDHVEALYNFGHLQQERGDLQAAATLMRRALAVRPLYARGWSGLATVLKSTGAVEAAMAACRHAIALNPKQTVARVTLANLCRDAGHAEEALGQLRAALSIEPENGSVLAYLVHQLQQCCDWAELPMLGARLDVANAAAIAAGRVPPEPPFAQLSRIDDPARNLVLARGWSHAFTGIVPLPAAPRPAADEPIRIGYLSNDLQDHPVGQLVAGLFPRHDRTRLHVSAYSWARDDGSTVRQRIATGVDSFVDFAGLGHVDAAERIRADGIEILIDLKGQTQGQRLEIMACRPAPVQATFLGFPGSSGAAFIDYIIGDRIVLPEGAESWLAEQPVRLPDCYMPPPDMALPDAPAGRRRDWSLPDDSVVLASFNNGYKIEPLLFDAWMAILKAAPSSVLWLHHYNDLVAGNLATEAKRRGVDPARLMFADRPARDVHLARLAHADLALDTRVFNGHVTTLDALCAGLPVITIGGRHFASRVAASLLIAAGMSELVMADCDGYVEKALALIGDVEQRVALRRRLQSARFSAPLFDAARYARGFDRALEAMAQRHRAGMPLAPIDVPAV